MDQLHEQLPYSDCDSQFFSAFPHQRLLMRFSGFHLPANKFPKKTSGFVCGTLAGQKPVTIPNQSRNHIGHTVTAFCYKDVFIISIFIGLSNTSC